MYCASEISNNYNPLKHSQKMSKNVKKFYLNRLEQIQIRRQFKFRANSHSRPIVSVVPELSMSNGN